MVSFAWMSLIAHDTWRTFSYKYWHQSRGIWRQMRARVMRHMAVGWLPTLILVVTCTALDQSNAVTIGYGANAGCWISNRFANLCVFTTPVSLSLVFNIVYFLRTIKAIRQTKRQTRSVTEQSQNESDFPIFTRIAALMGFYWLLGFLAMLINIKIPLVSFHNSNNITRRIHCHGVCVLRPSCQNAVLQFFHWKTRKEHRAFSCSRSYAATVEFSLNNKYTWE